MVEAVTHTVQSLQQLFAHQLQDAFAAEQALVASLQQLSQCQTNQQVRQVFRTHLAETQVHLDRLRQVFDSLGQRPTNARCEGMDGIIAEHDRFLRENAPAPQPHAMFDVGSGERVEHYEIAAYEELVRMATLLGMEQAAQTFESILADERRQLARLQDLANTMGQQQASQQPAGQPGATQPQTSGETPQQ